MADYDLLGAKWGERAVGTPGGQVTWSLAATQGYFFAFDARISQFAFQNLVRDAFDAWESVADIDFVEVSDSASVGIRLGWDAIDGRSNVIGQAQYSYTYGAYDQMVRSEIRFDTAEVWSTSKNGADSGINFYAVAVHEIGHAIGLGHSDDLSSIMYPSLRNQAGLSEDDIAGAQALYGAVEVEVAAVRGITFSGTAGADRYVGTSGNDVIDGRGGNDHLRGAGGADVIEGGVGLDIAAYAATVGSYRISSSGDEAIVTDLRGGSPDGEDQLISIERLHFSDGVLALDIDGAAGQIYRLYQAAFARTPDNDGLEFWIDVRDEGRSLYNVSKNFVASDEFVSMYYEMATNGRFVEQLYHNILGRDGDQGGIAFWTNALDSGSWNYASVLVGFSESEENKDNLASAIDGGIWFT